MSNIVGVILFCVAINGQPTVPCGAAEIEDTFSTDTACVIAVQNKQKDEAALTSFRVEIAKSAGMPEGAVYAGEMVSKSFCVEEDSLEDFYGKFGIE